METDQLYERIKDKQRVLVQILDLAKRQADQVECGDMKHLLGLLAAKQRLLQQLQDIEQQLDPFRGQDPEQRCWRTPEIRQAARRMAQQCESVLAEIVTLEKSCESKLIHRRDAAGERLQGVHRAAQATEAYTSTSLPPRTQLDLTSDQ